MKDRRNVYSEWLKNSKLIQSMGFKQIYYCRGEKPQCGASKYVPKELKIHDQKKKRKKKKIKET